MVFETTMYSRWIKHRDRTEHRYGAQYNTKEENMMYDCIHKHQNSIYFDLSLKPFKGVYLSTW